VCDCGRALWIPLEWWATEKDAHPAIARKLLNVECIAMTESECVQFQMLVPVTDLAELPAMLDDALLVHLAHPEIEPDRSTPIGACIVSLKTRPSEQAL
jgi:hypothetical protein